MARNYEGDGVTSGAGRLEETRGRNRAMKLDRKLKPGHWRLLADLAALGPDDDLVAVEEQSKLYARTLAKRGYAELVEEPGMVPGYVATESGRQALHDARLRGWLPWEPESADVR